MNLQTLKLVVFRDLNHDQYESELCLSSGLISPLAFPDLLIDISRLFR
jgi:hypothetical protein